MQSKKYKGELYLQYPELYMEFVNICRGQGVRPNTRGSGSGGLHSAAEGRATQYEADRPPEWTINITTTSSSRPILVCALDTDSSTRARQIAGHLVYMCWHMRLTGSPGEGCWLLRPWTVTGHLCRDSTRLGDTQGRISPRSQREKERKVKDP